MRKRSSVENAKLLRSSEIRCVRLSASIYFSYILTTHLEGCKNSRPLLFACVAQGMDVTTSLNQTGHWREKFSVRARCMSLYYIFPRNSSVNNDFVRTLYRKFK